LEPLLGVDHFRVGVSAEVDLSTTDQNEETYDPQKSSVTNSQKTEDGPGLNTTAGVPGTASNLPRPTAASSSAAAGASSYTRKTENISYQPSRVIKHIRLPQGTVKRLSLSVLVDHNLRWQGQRRIVEPPTPERLKVIRDLVAAATGFDSNRGDQLAVEALPFEATLTAEPFPSNQPQAAPQTSVRLPAWLQKLTENSRFMLIAAMAGGGMVALAAAVILWRRKTKQKLKIKAEATSAGAVTAGGSGAGDRPVTREEMERQIQERLEQHSAEISRKEAEALMNLQMLDVETKKAEVLQKHIAGEAKRDPAALAQVIRTWLDGDKRTR
jgi:flagellar M-ring protein FliF